MQERSGSLLFLTNRFNLLPILSGGLIKPREAFEKHYADWLTRAPGRIPLFIGGVSDAQCAIVRAESEQAYPVLIELDGTGIVRSSVPALGYNGDRTQMALPSDHIAAACIAVEGVIPVTAIRSVHFRSKVEHEEHSAREYENVRGDLVRFAVSPDLFKHTGPSIEDIDAWLQELPPASASPVEAIRPTDREAGITGMIAASAPADRRYIEILRRRLGGTKPARGNAADELCASWLVPAAPAKSKARTAASSPEAQEFAAFARVFETVDPTRTFRPVEIVSQLEHALAATELPDREKIAAGKMLMATRDVLRNERPFSKLKTGSRSVLNALLLVLLRPEPERVLTWAQEDVGAQDEDIVTAAAYSGAMYGWARTPVALRSSVEFERALSDWSATEIDRASNVPESGEPAGWALTVAAATSVAGEETVTLLLDDRPLLVKTQQPSSVLTDIVRGLKLDDLGTRLAIARLCALMQWDDCVKRTTLDWSGEHTTAWVKDGTRLTFAGLPTLAFEFDVDRLVERVRANSHVTGVGDALRALKAKSANESTGGSSRP